MTFAVIVALSLSTAMTAATVFTWFFHDQKHRELDQWIDYGFSRDTLRHALLYYRFMGLSMVAFFVLFVVSCLLLQADGHHLFTDVRRGTNAVHGGPIATLFFGLDLALRGAFFDVMEHFDLAVTHLHMNRTERGFVWYCFVFRTYFGLTLLKILVSFAWIWTKIKSVGKAAPGGWRGDVRRPDDRS